MRTTARPTATRCRCPPLSSAGRRSQQRAEIEHLGGGAHLALDARRIDALLTQAEAHVLARGHVRVERIVLEHHRDVALVRLELGDVALVEHDGAIARLLEPGDAGERRALAAARRAEQGQELAVLDRDVETVDRHHGVEPLGQPLQGHARHGTLSIFPALSP